jgi:hypothetical protein
MDMELEEVYIYLCSYDPRNPDGILDILLELDEDFVAPEDCSCDNCFYGRTDLAKEIIRLREMIDG